jgi:hypothetical protein
MTSPADADCWRRCNSCKKPIAFGAAYWVCNVSTCNRKRTGLVFCDVSCWDAHVPGMNHRESWAEERHAPTREEYARQLEEESKPTPRKRAPKPAADPVAPPPEPSKPKVVLRRSGAR